MASTQHWHDLAALRDGTLRVLNLNLMEGIITFPSLHAASGLLVILALWRMPYVRWFALLVSGIMIAATPIEGSHYFVDIIAGLVIAYVSFGLCRSIRPIAERESLYPTGRGKFASWTCGASAQFWSRAPKDELTS